MTALSYDPEAHEYRAGERKLHSVTGILSQCGLYDARWSKDKHRQRGEAVHRACRLIDAGSYDEAGTHEEIRPYAAQYRNFIEATGFKAWAWEIPMACPELGFAGTWDILGEAFREIWLVDVKSGTIPPLVGAQLAGYDLLIKRGRMINPGVIRPGVDTAEDWGKVGPIKRKVLNLAANNGRDRLRSYDESKWDSIFRACLTICNTKQEFNL